MTPKFSVIVPMYNVSRYIRECIESVLRQTCPKWELILVDDESEDDSLQIARAYEGKDERIRVLTKSHGGLPQTRNVGLEVAVGEYIALLDGDDYWDAEHLEKADRLIGASECDMCIINNHINFTQREQCEKVLFPFDEALNGAALEKKLSFIFDPGNHLPAAAVLTIYRLDFLKKYGIKYTEEYTCSEDLDFFLHSISHVKKIVFGDHRFYYYRQDNQAAMTKNMTGDMLLSRLNVYKKWYDYYEGITIGAFGCEKIQKKIACDVASNILLYYGLPAADPNKKEVRCFFSENRYIWCRGKWEYRYQMYLHYFGKHVYYRIRHCVYALLCRCRKESK